ncbi:glycosyltransferase family 2 protein [Cellulomonas endophytica]|uniref:glycosyltransferase family 2 protein n=1 Tax=Cellulomonas endophytica TaxID=2494735 RepID=UPI001011C026|nr:glycosyltransferase family A protein [Cellulomonas endophytica]
MSAGAPAVRCSVVVPVRDGAATLGRQLRALVAQSAPVPFEVVVADNGSTDGTAAVAAAFAPLVRVVDASAGVGVNVARTAGVAASTGELVLLCDADDLVHPGWVAAHWAAYAAGAVLLGGSLRHVTPDGRELGRQHRLNDDLRFLPWPTGANCGFAPGARRRTPSPWPRRSSRGCAGCSSTCS